MRSRLQLGGRVDDGAADFATRGTYILVLQTDARACSLLPAIRFNDYLRYEDLTAPRANASNGDGRIRELQPTGEG